LSFMLLFFSLIRRPPVASLFPYTTLFRSLADRLRREFRRRDVEEHVGARGLQLHDLRVDRRVAHLVGSLGDDHAFRLIADRAARSEEHTSELQSRSDLVCRLLLEKKK